MKEKVPEYDVILLYARDWSIEDGPIDVCHAFKPYYAWVCGFLIRENKDSYCLCPELFDGRARHVQTIPKECVKEILYLRHKNDP